MHSMLSQNGVADPVFYWYQEEMDLPFVRPGGGEGMEEIKLSPLSWNASCRGSEALPDVRLPLAAPPGHSIASRLGPRDAWYSETWASSGVLSPGNDTLASWSPLIGLGHTGDVFHHADLGVRLSALGSDSLVAMEEKDIWRDFISKVRLSEPVAAPGRFRRVHRSRSARMVRLPGQPASPPRNRAALGDLLQIWIDVDPPVRAHHGPERLLVRTLGRRLG